MPFFLSVAIKKIFFFSIIEIFWCSFRGKYTNDDCENSLLKCHYLLSVVTFQISQNSVMWWPICLLPWKRGVRQKNLCNRVYTEVGCVKIMISLFNKKWH